jgi:probable lipoprotein NlpC
MTAYRDLFGVTLPRTTDAQAQAGQGVSRTAVQTGDLIFFRPSGKSRHVGIYLGNREFAHASTSNGVMISRLDEPYWQDAYWTSRRVLSMPLAQTQPASLPLPPRDSPEARRSGW